jgi:hypothetical protein
MGIKAALSKPYAKFIVKGIYKDAKRAVDCQKEVFNDLIRQGAKTAFGKDHGFANIESPKEFRQRVPVVDYEDLTIYITRAKNGESDILWPGKPMYFCKTSGTTSGTKFIPLTKDSMPNHIHGARNALLCHIANSNASGFVDGKMIFLQGSPELHYLESGIPYGRLSGIVAHHVPAYLQKNRMPSFETNCIDDWELKVDTIVEETIKEDMTLISGIPAWVQMYFERILEKTGKKKIAEVFPNFDLFVYGGVNFEPYRQRFEQLIGKPIPSVELYPASEGFIAYQDAKVEDGLLLNINSGIWFEFIPADKFFDENPPRLSLEDVEIGVNYALIINSNAGLWGYSIGDTIKFVSLDLPRIKVTGRIKHFTSAFGEHVIAEEVEAAMAEVLLSFKAKVSEFHVAPQVSPAAGLPYHEWFIEFEEMPDSLEEMALELDKRMCQMNPYYLDLIQGNILRTVVITPLPSGAFHGYMKSKGKLGGQNKLPRLGNDRQMAEVLEKYSLT